MLTLLVMALSNVLHSDECDIQDIKVSCACENKSHWKIEKIPENVARKFFENCPYFSNWNCLKGKNAKS